MKKIKRLVCAIWCAFLVMLMPGMAKEMMRKSDNYTSKKKH